MLRVQSSINLLAVQVSGAWDDLEAIDCSIRALLIDRCFPDTDTVHTRLLPFCQQLHCTYTESKPKKLGMGMINYYSTYFQWPELLFDTLLLSNYICFAMNPEEIHSRKMNKNSIPYTYHGDKDLIYIQFFQQLVWNELKSVIGNERFEQRLSFYIKEAAFTDYIISDYTNFCLPYLDYLNAQYAHTNVMDRRQKLADIAEIMAGMEEKYQNASASVRRFAQKHRIPESEVVLGESVFFVGHYKFYLVIVFDFKVHE